MARRLNPEQLDRLGGELFKSRNPAGLDRLPDSDFLVGFRSKLSAELEAVSWNPLMIGDLGWRFAPVFATVTLILAGLLIVKPFESSTATVAEQIFWSTVSSSENTDLTRDHVAEAILVYGGGEEGR